MNAKALPVVSIIGRTNVGKSTLFNALLGARKAVVRDSPGVTRDRCYEVVTRFWFPFALMDTGALVGEEDISLHRAVRAQSELAMQQSDLLIVVFDGLHGLHPQDHDVVDLVRQMGKPAIFVANKCEKPSSALISAELYSLGIEELIPMSAAHRRGMMDLVKKMAEVLGAGQERLDAHARVDGDEPGDEAGLTAEEADFDTQGAVPLLPEGLDEIDVPVKEVINFAVLGKPNVGKSTFVNKLLGEERMITSPIAGTTRDSIESKLVRDGRAYAVVDTAGLRKKAGVRDGTVERFSNLRTLRSLALCDVAVFLLDASEGLPTEQDARIVGLAHEKGKPIVIVINKWDLIEKDAKTAEAYRAAVRYAFKFAAYAPLVFVSALTGQRCLTVLDHVREVFEASQRRVSTSEVNNIFVSAFATKPPPVYRGFPIKLLYATQVAVQPPTFTLFVNYPDRLNFAYERYLKNSMRKKHPFVGTDIRILFRRRSQLGNDRRRAA